ncbi:MAG: MFS transporter [Erysipelotrichaceae bacterium]|nr:MFS transporter [Erysipelotrichaceae bacterium]
MERKKLWTGKFITVVIINAISGFALYISNPIMANYLVSKGVVFEYTGIIASLLSWIAMLFRPFSGAMSDRMNKKKLLIVAYSLTALCLCSYTLVSSIPAIIVTRIVHGVAFAITGTITMSFATTFIPKEQTAEGISYLGLVSLIGSMLGPQIGTKIYEKIGISYVFYVSAILCICCFVLLNFIKYEHVRKESLRQQKFKLDDFFAKELSLYVILVAVLTLGNGIISYYLVDFGESRGIENISLFFTIYSFTLIIIKPFIGKLQDKKGIKIILYPAFLLYAIGIVILSKSYTLTPVLIAGVLKALGQGNGTPAIQAESVKQLSSDRSGVAISTCFIGQDIGNAVGPIFASSMAGAIGYEQMFMLYACLLIISLFIYILNNYLKKRKV